MIANELRCKGTIKRIQNKIKQKKTRCYFENFKTMQLKKEPTSRSAPISYKLDYG